MLHELFDVMALRENALVIAIALSIAAPHTALGVPPFQETSCNHAKEQKPDLPEKVSEFIGAIHSCQLIETSGLPLLKAGTLSPFWAQEYVGADLAFDELSRTERTPVKIAMIDGKKYNTSLLPTGALSPIAMVDNDDKTQKGEHATNISTILAGPQKMGLLPNEQIVALTVYGDGAEISGAVEKVSRSGAQVVNMSFGVWNSEKNEIALKSLTDKNVMVTIAAGNSYPYSPIDLDARSLHGFVAGNMDTDGLIFRNSQQGREIVTVAPSAETIETRLPDGTALLSGGTSAASPLVGQAISHVLSLAPSMTIDEMRHLIEMTNVPLISSRAGSNENGTGMLNDYKLVMVAKRLKAGGFPANKSVVFDSSLYDFKNDSENLALKAESLWRKGDCDSQREALTFFRKAFLLNPSESVRQRLVSIYRELGLTENAKFFESLQHEPESNFKRLLETASSEPRVGRFGTLPSERDDLYMFASRFPDGSPIAKLIGEALLSRNLASTTNQSISQSDIVRDAVTLFPNPAAKLVLKDYFKNHLNTTSITGTKRLRRETRDFISELLTSTDPKLREAGAWQYYLQAMDLKIKVPYENSYMSDRGQELPVPSDEEILRKLEIGLEASKLTHDPNLLSMLGSEYDRITPQNRPVLKGLLPTLKSFARASNSGDLARQELDHILWSAHSAGLDE